MQTTMQLHIDELDEQVIESLKQMFEGKEVEISVKTVAEKPKKEGKPSKTKTKTKINADDWKDSFKKASEGTNEGGKRKSSNAFEDKMKEKMSDFEKKMEDSDFEFDFKEIEEMGQKALRSFLKKMEKYKR